MKNLNKKRNIKWELIIMNKKMQKWWNNIKKNKKDGILIIRHDIFSLCFINLNKQNK